MIDFSSAQIDFRLIGPEIALLLAAFTILLTGCVQRLARFSPGIALIGLVASLFMAMDQLGNQQSGFYGMVTCDNFGVVFKMIFAVSSTIIVLISYQYLKVRKLDRPEYYAMILFSTMGMMVMANTTDLVVMFIGLEILSVPLYVMAGMAKKSLESNEAGIKYFVMGSFASAFLLMGIAFIFGASGTTDLRRLVADYSFISTNFGVYLYAGTALVLTGFAFKVAAVPFHSWVPDVYQGAPTPVTAFFSVGPKAAGFAALLRIFSFGLAEVEMLAVTLWILAALTMSVGNILALKQNNIKRMLAYSSIAHTGYILVAMAVGGAEAISAAVFYLIAYALFNLGAFAVIVLLETRLACKSDLTELRGLSNLSPYLAVVLAVFMFALSGFPPTVGFFGKFYIFSAAVKDGFIWLAVIGVMNSFVSVYYYLRVVKTIYFEPAQESYSAIPYSPALLAVLGITIIGTLGFGIFPEKLLEISKAAMFAFL